MKTSSQIKRLMTLPNLKIALTIAVGASSIFGLISPETATRLRNEVLFPIGLVASMTAGDL